MHRLLLFRMMLYFTVGVPYRYTESSAFCPKYMGLLVTRLMHVDIVLRTRRLNALFARVVVASVMCTVVRLVDHTGTSHLLLVLRLLEVRRVDALGVLLRRYGHVFVAYVEVYQYHAHTTPAHARPSALVGIPRFVAAPGVCVLEPPPRDQASPMLLVPWVSKTLLSSLVNIRSAIG